MTRSPTWAAFANSAPPGGSRRQEYLDEHPPGVAATEHLFDDGIDPSRGFKALEVRGSLRPALFAWQVSWLTFARAAGWALACGMSTFTEAMAQAATRAADQVTAHLPQLLGALVLLLVGWLLARVLRLATRRGAAMLDALVARSSGRLRWRSGRSGPVLGSLVYWVVLLFFVTAATQTLGLQTFTDWLARLLDHLPTLAAGLLIIGAGYLLSGFVADLVTAAATGLAAPQRTALARMAQGATLVVALLIGADQIGLKVTWIAILAIVLLAAMLFGLTIAVGLGSRSYVANLIGAHYLRQALRLGQRVRVGEQEGRIVDVSATSLVLETPQGRILLPGRVYHDQVIHLLARDDGAAADAA